MKWFCNGLETFKCVSVYTVCATTNRKDRCTTVISYFPNVTKWKMSWFLPMFFITSLRSVFFHSILFAKKNIKTIEAIQNDTGIMYRNLFCLMLILWSWFRMHVDASERGERMLQVVKMKSAMFSCLCRTEVSSIGNGKWHIWEKSYCKQMQTCGFDWNERERQSCTWLRKK